MTGSQLLVGGAITLIVVLLAATLYIAVSGSSEVVSRVRDRLFARISPLRLRRMLHRQDVKLEEYVRETSAADIEKAIQTCDECPSTARCDDVLNQPDSKAVDLSFCPNMEKIAKKKGKKGEKKEKKGAGVV